MARSCHEQPEELLSMNILRLAWHSSRHFLGRGAGYYRDTGNFPRTLLYMVKYAHSMNHRRKAQRRALAAHRMAARSAAGVLPGISARPRLAIKISGGIGDYIVIARFVRDLVEEELFDFDIYCANESGADWVFSSIPGFRDTFSEFLFEGLAPSYSLALSVSQFAAVYHVQRGTLDGHQRLKKVVYNLSRSCLEIEAIVEHHPHLDGFLGQKAVFTNFNRANFLHGMAGIAYRGPELGLSCNLSVFEQLGLGSQAYVTINNGFDPGFIVTRAQATKCYPHCEELVRRFKKIFPGVRVVQIGTATSTAIESADVDLIGRTTLQQAAGLLSGAQLHIDNEGGLVHIARSLGVRSCVIFGPTSLDYFAYPDNINIRPTFCGGCWWVNSTWMDVCPRGFETARCMSTQKPEDIVAAIGAAGFARAIDGTWRPDRAGAPPAPVHARELESMHPTARPV
ncbi:MAG TPA: glycosyltransferase family 9 protein, partial [Hyphomicrobiaceae bacterium]